MHQAFEKPDTRGQELFDTVVRHLKKQGRQALVDSRAGVTGETSMVCVYRSPEGLKCAVGCLIPDELYEPSMENKSYDYHNLEFSKVYPLLGGEETYPLLRALQLLHDGAEEYIAEAKMWGPQGLSAAGVKSLYNIAANHKLSTAVVAEMFPSVVS